MLKECIYVVYLYINQCSNPGGEMFTWIKPRIRILLLMVMVAVVIAVVIVEVALVAIVEVVEPYIYLSNPCGF